MQFSVRYVLLFSAAVCGVCAIFVSSLAVGLRERQEVNELLFKQRNVLEAAGLLESGEAADGERIGELFKNVESMVIELATGNEVTGIDAGTFDQQAAKRDPETSTVAPKNSASVFRLPNNAQVFKVKDQTGQVSMLILPIEGYGLWSTLYGFIALDADSRTVRGLTYYDHGETPGLGGEVDNPRWKALWSGRKAFDEGWQMKLEVIKGSAGKPAEDPYRVDGLSGATITSRGVTNMLQFWLGPHGFESFLKKFRAQGGAA
jgi:Na+-transporting NADH:ubiquinone oxidoreductase subunit C